MNANALNFDLYALAKPKSRADLVALAMEAHAELDRIEDYFSALFKRLECPEAA